jgi:hypothetical protein
MELRLRRVSRSAVLRGAEIDLLARACEEERKGGAPRWPAALEPFERMPSGLPDYV